MQKRHDAGFAGTCGAYKCHGLARLHPEAHIIKDGMAGNIGKADTPELDRGRGALGKRDSVWRIDNLEGHIQHLGQALPRGHGALHHGILHGQRPDRVKKALDEEQESHHHAHIKRAIQHHRAAHNDHHRHRQPGQRVNHRDQHLRITPGNKMRAQICTRHIIVKLCVDGLSGHPLNGAHTMDCLGQRTIGDRIRLMRGDKGSPCARQPHDANKKQNRQDRQRQKPKLPVKPEHATHDPEQQNKIAHRNHRSLEKFLHRVHITLQARHEAPDFGAVHEGLRHLLKMAKHRFTDVEQNILGHLAHRAFLNQAGDIVGGDGGGKGGHSCVKRAAPGTLGQADVKGMADDHRD